MPTRIESMLGDADGMATRGRAFLARNDETILLVTMLGITLWFVVHTHRSYSPNARLFPMIVLVALVGMILVRIAFHLGLATRFDMIQRFLEEQARFTDVTATLLSDGDETSNPLRVLRMCGWLVVLTAMMAWIGILTSIPLFVVVFVLLETDLDVVRAFGVALVTYLFVYGLFVFILGLRI